MPNISKNRIVSDELPIKTFDSASYQINGGTLIAAATQTADALPFTDTVTVTGIALTDKRIGITPRDAIVIPNGLALVSVVPSATNTIQVTWQNTTLSPIAPPAAAVWSVAVFGNFYS
jgi:hypothetical protein